MITPSGVNFISFKSTFVLLKFEINFILYKRKIVNLVHYVGKANY